MNARGSTEVIVASVGLSIGALNADLYTMIVAMAVATTMVMPPTLRWALARLPMRDGEKERLEHEEFEANGFVANFERILLACDDSPSGQLAGRLAGLIAGPRGLPMTTLKVEPRAWRTRCPRPARPAPPPRARRPPREARRIRRPRRHPPTRPSPPRPARATISSWWG